MSNLTSNLAHDHADFGNNLQQIKKTLFALAGCQAPFQIRICALFAHSLQLLDLIGEIAALRARSASGMTS